MAARLRRETRSNNSLGCKGPENPAEGAVGGEGTSEEPSVSGESGDVKRRQKKDRERRFSAPPGGRRQHGADRDSIGSYLSESQGVLLIELGPVIKVFIWYFLFLTVCLCCLLTFLATNHHSFDIHPLHTHTHTHTHTHMHTIDVPCPHTVSSIHLCLVSFCLSIFAYFYFGSLLKVDSDDEESVQSEVSALK